MSDFFESLKQSTRASRDVTTRTRGFELVSSETNQDLLPKRETAHAAGYDLKPAKTLLSSPVKLNSYQQASRLICCLTKSCTYSTVAQTPRKRGLILINSVGVIDHDYYE